MYLFKREKDLKEYLIFQRSSGHTIGFVPTMGALHQGHLSLIEQSKAENKLTVCSIFVNPTQFNNSADLERYPRTPEKDADLLVKVGCDILFLPGVDEIYPEDGEDPPPLNFGSLTTVMEGRHRPGHFDGVVQVVHRLLQIVEPDRLYMGEKDFQQYMIIKTMIEKLKMPTQIVGVAIKREEDGLAMSSRNVRLSEEERLKAVSIYQTLQGAKVKMKTEAPKAIQQWAMQELELKGFRPEYFEIVDQKSLKTIEQFGMSDAIVACTAAWLGDVRLIDNLIFK